MAWKRFVAPAVALLAACQRTETSKLADVPRGNAPISHADVLNSKAVSLHFESSHEEDDRLDSLLTQLSRRKDAPDLLGAGVYRLARDTLGESYLVLAREASDSTAVLLVLGLQRPGRILRLNIPKNVPVAVDTIVALNKEDSRISICSWPQGQDEPGEVVQVLAQGTALRLLTGNAPRECT